MQEPFRQPFNQPIKLRPTYHIARYEARFVRALYKQNLPVLVRQRIRSPRELDVHVVAFSSARDLPEQVASLRSFLRFAGVPRSYTIASDGSHSLAQRDLLRQMGEFVDVVDWNVYARQDLPPAVYRYADVNPMGKKLAVIASLPSQPTLYVDSDVLFFPGALDPAVEDVLAARRSTYQTQGWNVGYIDSLLPDTTGHPVNAGFITVAKPLDWSDAFARLPESPRPEDLYLEQTLVHIAMRQAGASPLPIREFPLHNNDQFLYRDAHDPHRTVLRHYVSITRPKFWLALARHSTFRPASRYVPERYLGWTSATAPVAG